jgi:hypothetical protein
MILKSGENGPKLSDPYEQSIKAEMVAEGLSFPTSIEQWKYFGFRKRTLEKEPVLKLNVENQAERGLLGVAILKDNKVLKKEHSINNNNDDRTNAGFVNNESTPKVFLYYTEKSEFENENKKIPRNKVLSYEWNKQNKSLWIPN